MIYPALLWPFKFMPNCSVGPSEYETEFSSKEIWYGLRENAWFHLCCFFMILLHFYRFSLIFINMQIR